MAGPAPNPNVPCDNAVNQPVMAYNIARLEMLALGQTLGQWLRRQENPDFSMEFESEVRILFREYARANPAAGVQELDGPRLIHGLQRNDPRGVRDFAVFVAQHPQIMNAFRRIRETIH